VKLLAVFLLASSACGNQDAACRRAFEDRPGQPSAIVEQCIRERWSDSKIACMQRAGGGLVAMFCQD
jgi:hypothetical protein